MFQYSLISSPPVLYYCFHIHYIYIWYNYIFNYNNIMLFIALNNLMLFGETGEEKIYIYLISYLPKYFTILRTLNSLLWIWIPVWLHFLSAWRASFSFSWRVYLTGMYSFSLFKTVECLYFNLHFWRIVLLDIEFFFDFFFFSSP